MHGATIDSVWMADFSRTLMRCVIGASVVLQSASLFAAPDPDLFDGRISSSSSGASGVSAASGEVEGQNSVDASGGDAGESGPDETVGGAQRGGDSSEGEIINAADGGDLGDGTSDASQDVAGSGSSFDSASGRDFSSIGGVGVGAANEVMVVNSSKASRSDPVDFELDLEATEDASREQQGSGIGSGGSQTMKGVPQRDYGDSLPSGL